METLHDVALDIHRLFEQFDPYGFREFVGEKETIESAIERIARDNANPECINDCLTDLERMADDWEEKGHVKDLRDRFEEVVCKLPYKVERYDGYGRHTIEIDGVVFQKIAEYSRPAHDGCFGVYNSEVYAFVEDDIDDKCKEITAWLRTIPTDRFEETLTECGLDLYKHHWTFAETSGQMIRGSEEVRFVNDCIYITQKVFRDV